MANLVNLYLLSKNKMLQWFFFLQIFQNFKILHKIKLNQIGLRIVKFPNHTTNIILNNFDFHGQPSKSDIFLVTEVANSKICIVSSSINLQIREFSIAVTQNILDLEGRSWRSKLLRMLCFVKFRSLKILR